MAYKISLDTDVTCYELLDNGKIFVNKEISTYIDFTDKTVLQEVDVEEKFDAQGLDEKAVVLPVFSQIERIGDTALCGRNLQHAKFPGLLSIDAYGLRENNLLENIELDQVKRIGQGGFLDCKNLHKVRIGSSIEEIAVDAFRKSDPQDPQSIQDLTIDRLSTEVRGAESGFGLDDRTVIHFKEPAPQPVPPTPEVTAFLSVADGVQKHSLNDAGKAYWNEELSAVVDLTQHEVVQKDYVGELPDRPFVVEFSQNLLSVGDQAFAASKIARGHLPETLLSIGNAAFAQCSSYQPNLDDSNLRHIGGAAFICADVKTANFKQLDQLCVTAFANTGLQIVRFENDIRVIGPMAFPAQTSAYFTQYKQVLRNYENYPWGLAEENIFAPEMTDVPSCMTLDQENLTKDLVEHWAIVNYTVASALTGLVIQGSCKTIASDAFSTCTNVTSAFFAERNMNQIRAMGEIPFGLGSRDYIYPEKEVVDLSTLVLHSTLVDSAAVDAALLEQGLTKDQVLTALFDYRCLSVQNGALAGLDNMTNVVFDSMNILDIGNQTFAGLTALSDVAFTDCQEYMVRGMPGYPFGISRSKVHCGRDMRRAQTIWIDAQTVTREVIEDALFKAGGSTDTEWWDFFTFALTPNCRRIESRAFAGITDNTNVDVNNQVSAIAADAFDQTCYVNFHKRESDLTAMSGYPFGLTVQEYKAYWATAQEIDLSRYTHLTQSIFQAEYEAQYDPDAENGWFSMKFNDNLTDIGPSCFCIHGRLRSRDLLAYGIDLPASVEHVGEHAFDGLREVYELYCNAKTIDCYEVEGYKYTMLAQDSNVMAINLPRVQHLDGILASDCWSLYDIEVPELSSVGKSGEDLLLLFYNCPILRFRAPKLKNFVGTVVFNDSEDYNFDPEEWLKVVELENAETFGPDYWYGRLDNLSTVSYVRMPHVLSAYGWPYGESCLVDLKLPLARYIEEFNYLPALTAVHLPEALEIANYSLRGNSKLEEVYLPKVKTIGNYAFENDSALLSIDLPEAENIGNQAFSRCTSLEKVRVKNNKTISMLRRQPNYPWGIDDESKFVVQYDTSYNIVLSDEVIDKAFVDNWTYEWNSDIPSISGLTIESGCKRIESGSFENFVGLSNVTIPNTVDFVGKAAFYGCSNLTLKFANRTWEQMAAMPGYPFGLPTAQLRATTAKPRIDSPLKLATDVACCKASEDGKIFVNMSKCAVLDGTAEIVTKDLVDQKLQDIALNRDTSFKVIACLSSSTTQLGDEAFAGLSNLYYVDFADGHNNLTSIEKASFKDCNVVSSIMFEAWNMHDVAICSAYPFGLFNDMCLSATDMADVTVIDHDVGDWHIPGLSGCSFALIRKGCQYVYGSSDRRDYYFANNPNLSTVICKYPCEIYYDAFYNCSAITEIDFPEVEYIGSYAFYCNNAYYAEDSWPQLSSIKLPKCKDIGYYAFYQHPNIEELDLPEVEDIGENAFGNELERTYHSTWSTYTYGKSSKLRKVNAPKCKWLNGYTFHNCANLTSINMPELEMLGQNDFSLDFSFDSNYYTYKDKPILREINLPKVEQLAPYTFYGQSALVDINVPQLTGIAEKALGHTGLTSFNAGYLTLYPYALAEMDLISANLENATFGARDGNPAGYGMFYSDTKLSAVKMDNMTMLPSYMFSNCRKLSSVSFDKNKITSHGDSVFGYYYYEEEIAPYAKTVKYLDFPNLTGSNSGYKFSCYRNLISANLPRMTSIREYDFAYLPNFVSVYMPNCTLIESGAFYESGIEEFYVPRSVTSIARDSDGYSSPFYGCSKLTDLSVQSGNNAYFSDKGGKHYPAIFKWINPSDQTQGYQLWIATNGLSSLPDGLTKISEGDLEYMKSLTSIYIPATLTSDLYHLHGLSALQAISVAQGNTRYTDMNGSNVLVEKYREPHRYVNYINLKIDGLDNYYSPKGKSLNLGRFAFGYSSHNTFSGSHIIHDSDGNTYSEDGDSSALAILKSYSSSSPTFQYEPKAFPYTLSIQLGNPVDIKNISDWTAWKSNQYSFPSRLHVLISQNGTDFVEIGSSTCSYGYYSTPSQWNYYQNFGAVDTSIIHESFDDIQLRLLAGCGSSRLCGDIEIIETGAFAERNALTSLVCEEPTLSALKEIQSGAFDSCANLKELKIACPTEGAAQIKVGYQAIKYNGAMLSLELANISSFATTSDRYHEPLAGCDRLEHIELDGISAIPEYLCQARANLKSAKFDGIVEVKTNCFNNCYELSSASFGSELTAIRSGAFDGCNKLTGINDVNYSNIKVVESAAFRGTKLQKAEFSQLTSIADFTFAGTRVSSINMPLLKNIGSGALSGCKFTDIDLPGVQSIGSGAFAENKQLSAVNLPDLTSIGTGYYGAFGFCDKLLSIELPHLKSFAGLQYNSMLCIVAPEATSIANYAFQNCSSLICVDVSQATSIGNYAFERCIALSSVVLPNATTIGYGAFTDCSSISELKIPSISSIYSDNFRGCSALTSLEFEKLKEVGYDTFSHTALREITLPSTLTYLHMNAFNYGYTEWDEQKETYRVYYETLCPDLSMVWFKGRSYDKVISEIDREDYDYYDEKPYIYAKGVPYWGIDRKYIKLDNKYTSILKLATGTKRYDLADGGIIYSKIPILDLTDTTKYNPSGSKSIWKWIKEDGATLLYNPNAGAANTGIGLEFPDKYKITSAYGSQFARTTLNYGNSQSRFMSFTAEWQRIVPNGFSGGRDGGYSSDQRCTITNETQAKNWAETIVFDIDFNI